VVEYPCWRWHRFRRRRGEDEELIRWRRRFIKATTETRLAVPCLL